MSKEKQNEKKSHHLATTLISSENLKTLLKLVSKTEMRYGILESLSGVFSYDFSHYKGANSTFTVGKAARQHLPSDRGTS